MIVGRDAELARLRELSVHVAAGRGGVVWVEGEPGIGKSALLETGLADTERLGCQLLWGTADELGQRLPLRAVLDALGVHTRARDPRRAEIAHFLETPATSGVAGFGTFDPIPTAIERLLGLVDQLCADAPVVLVLDDLQWADEASLLVWQRLTVAVPQVPLLLVGASRPIPRRAELTALRQRWQESTMAVIHLNPLDADEASELASALIGTPPADGVRRSLARAGGNPLYIRELTSALVTASGRPASAEASDHWLPASLTEAIAARFGFLSEATTGVLRVASLLGTEFSVTELAVVSGQPPRALVPVVEEATASGVLTEAGVRLRFRHPLFRETLYSRMPLSLRDALHMQAARALADAGSGLDRIAQQLLFVTALDDPWVREWLTSAAPDLTYRLPSLAWELLSRVAEQLPRDDPGRETLEAHLANVGFLLARYDDVLRIARRLLTHTADADRTGEATWLLGYALMRRARFDEALGAIGETVRQRLSTEAWIQRLRALQGMILVALSRHDEAEQIIDELVDEHPDKIERIAAGYALHAKAVIYLRRHRDRQQAVATIDRALSIVEDDARASDLRVMLLMNRTDDLLELDLVHEAETTLQRARLLAETTGIARVDSVRVRAAECDYALGRWDDAATELESIVTAFDSRFDPLVTSGLAGLIAVHRDDRTTARQVVASYAHQDLFAADTRSTATHMVLARALMIERDGDLSRALAGMLPILDDEIGRGMDESYLALPDVTRLAMAVGDAATAVAAARAAEGRAHSPTAHGQAIVEHCRAVAEDDPAPLLAVIDSYFRRVPRPFELARALEDAAVLLAEHGAPDRARTCVSEAVDLYSGLGAVWDIRRADTRLRALGVRRGSRGPRHRPATGWDALTPTEHTVAALVAQGRSNPDIAGQLFLSRSTVQTHVSHILAKLGLNSRGQVAHLALQHDPATAKPAP